MSKEPGDIDDPAPAPAVEPVTFAQLPIGAIFNYADSPKGSPKRKTGFERWAWAGHKPFIPTANGCRADREVVLVEPTPSPDPDNPAATEASERKQYAAAGRAGEIARAGQGEEAS